MGKDIQKGREGNEDLITQNEHLLSGVENAILSPGHWGGGLKSNRDLEESEVWRCQSRRWWPATT